MVLPRYPLSEAESDAYKTLLPTFDWVRTEFSSLGITGRRPVLPGSALAGDDDATRPLQTSHAARHLILVAMDHLHLVAEIVGTAQTIHISSPYTLIRSAIENSSAALWILAPPARADRIRRTLVLNEQDRRDEKGMLTDLELPRAARTASEAKLERRRSLIADVARRAGVSDPAGGPLKTTTVMIAEACRDAGVEPGLVRATWRACSGFAHGRRWASLAFGELEELSEADASVVNGRLMGSVQSMAPMYRMAVLTTRTALLAFDRLRSSPDGSSTVSGPDEATPGSQ